MPPPMSPLMSLPMLMPDQSIAAPPPAPSPSKQTLSLLVTFLSRFETTADFNPRSDSVSNAPFLLSTSHLYLYFLSSPRYRCRWIMSSSSGNGPAAILISLLLNGYEPYYHAEPSKPHPDPILHSMLAPTALEGCRPKSMLKQVMILL